MIQIKLKEQHTQFLLDDEPSQSKRSGGRERDRMQSKEPLIPSFLIR